MPLSPIIKKLLFVRQFDIDEGKIKLLGDREIMLHASALLELQEIDETKLYDIAKQSSLKQLSGAVEHAKVYSKMKDVFIEEIASLGKKIGETDQGVIKTLQEIFEVYGLGQMTIEDIDNSGKKASIIIRDSTIADEWGEKHGGKSKAAICTITAGVLAGIFSYIFGKTVDCVETKCKAEGNSYCMFNIG